MKRTSLKLPDSRIEALHRVRKILRTNRDSWTIDEALTIVEMLKKHARRIPTDILIDIVGQEHVADFIKRDEEVK